MYRSLENTIKEAMMSADERMAMNKAQMLKKQGKKKELKDFMMAMDMNLRNKVKKSLGEELQEQEDPTNPDTGGAEETEMGMRQLHFIKYASEEIMEYVKMKGDMDEWFQNKLTTVHDMIRGLHSYIEGDKRLKGMVSEETMELAGVTLQNMEHCPGAVAAFKQNLKDGANEKDVAIAAQAVDAYLAIEDKVKEEGEAEPEDVEKMKALIANAKKVISEKGLKGHAYHDMHLKRVMDMLEDEDEDEDEDEEEMNEKTLTPAEKKKREEIAKAIERENPNMPMAKKMAIATASAKKVAEETKPDAEDLMHRKRQMAGISQSDKDKLSKVRQMLDKEKKPVSEISDTMKQRYINKAMGSHQHANAVRKDAESRGDTETAAKARATMNKRNKGMTKAFGEADEGEKAITRRGDYSMEKVRMPDGSYKWKKKPKSEIKVEQGINTPAPRPAPKPFPGTKKPKPFGF